MIPHTVHPLRPRRTPHVVAPRPLTPNGPTVQTPTVQTPTATAWTPDTLPTATVWTPPDRIPVERTPAGSDVEQARAVLALPPVLAGESVQVLLMTDHGTYLADATVTHTAPTDPGPGWSLSADLAVPRATFALAATADRLPTPTPDPTPTGFTDWALGAGPGPVPHSCPGCLATRDQPCRWAHRARQHPDVTADADAHAAHGPADPDPLDEYCPGCNAEPGEPCRWSCLSWVTNPDHSDRDLPDPSGEATNDDGDRPTD